MGVAKVAPEAVEAQPLVAVTTLAPKVKAAAVCRALRRFSSVMGSPEFYDFLESLGALMTARQASSFFSKLRPL
jgi:hypothetical protein